ncbi:MAG TPA: FAD-dependent oxidoreductase, partial [Solirubrobacteraceae bacterium]
MDSNHDVVIAGGGHNALVAAAYLARAGRSVLVLERRDHVGGAAVSERPFAGVDARLSRYAYLVSLMPRRIIDELGLDIELRRRRIGAYAPGVLIGPDPTPGWTRLYETCARVARVVAPSLLEPLKSHDELRAAAGADAWDALVTRPIGALIEDC